MSQTFYQGDKVKIIGSPVDLYGIVGRSQEVSDGLLYYVMTDPAGMLMCRPDSLRLIARPRSTR